MTPPCRSPARWAGWTGLVSLAGRGSCAAVQDRKTRTGCVPQGWMVRFIWFASFNLSIKPQGQQRDTLYEIQLSGKSPDEDIWGGVSLRTFSVPSQEPVLQLLPSVDIRRGSAPFCKARLYGEHMSTLILLLLLIWAYLSLFNIKQLSFALPSCLWASAKSCALFCPWLSRRSCQEPIHTAILGAMCWAWLVAALALSLSQTAPNKPTVETGLLIAWKRAVLQLWSADHGRNGLRGLQKCFLIF